MLLDDLLLAPFRGLLWVFEQVHDAAQEEMAGEAAAITDELRQLHLMLEAGQITEGQFDTHERRLLDRLEVIENRESESGQQDNDDEDVALDVDEHGDDQVDGQDEDEGEGEDEGEDE